MRGLSLAAASRVESLVVMHGPPVATASLVAAHELSSWVGRIDTVKMTILPKATTDSIQSLSNYQWHFSQNQNKRFHNSYGKTEDPE